MTRADRRLIALKVMAPFVLVALVIGMQSGRAVWKLRDDLLVDARIAYNLVHYGVFSDAPARDGAPRPSPTRAAPPAFPALLALVAGIDGGLKRELGCIARTNDTCAGDRSRGVMPVLQMLAAIASLVLIFLLALELSGSREIASLTMLLALLLGRFGDFGRFLGPDSFHHAALFGGLWVLAAAVARRRLLHFLLAGIAIGICALFQSQFFWAALLASPLICLSLERDLSSRWRLAAGGLFVAGAGIVVLPWLLRNAAVFGSVTMISDRDALLLARRIGYNAMTWETWQLSWIYWCPGLGVDVLPWLYQTEVVERLGGPHAGAYPEPAARALLKSAGNEGASAVATFATLLGRHVAGHPGQHLAVTLPVLFRGMWGSSMLLVIGLAFFLPPLVRVLRATRKLAPFLVVACVVLAVLVVQAFLTPNGYYMNTAAMVLIAYAAAYNMGGV